jgi:transcriptional regulator with XRE-family HTH domain
MRLSQKEHRFMDRKQEEIVQRITARYIEEVRSGHQPNMSDYLARYPQFADEIADFIAYYHAVEVGLPHETDQMPILTEQFHEAIDTAWERVAQSQGQATSKVTSLLARARELHLSLSQLADKLGVSADVVLKLERRTIEASSIPGELITLLAKVLQQPSQVIQAFFGITVQQRVTEARTSYRVDGQVQSFREAIEESAQLSEDQRRRWRELLDREEL